MKKHQNVCFKVVCHGFTLVELLVAIAVVGVLATVSVVGYIKFVNRANVASDLAFIVQLNSLLKSTAVTEGNNKTAYDAVSDCIENGIAEEDITASAGDILWDSKNDCFVLLTNKITYTNDVYSKPKNVGYFKIFNKNNVYTGESTYSIYLGEGALSNVDALCVSTGIDVGNYRNLYIEYNNLNGPAQEVTIRTNSAFSTLKINAYVNNNYGDTIFHYGTTGVLTVVSLAMNSLHSYGRIVKADIDCGRVVVEAEGIVQYAEVSQSGLLVNNGSSAVTVQDNNNIQGEHVVKKDYTEESSNALATAQEEETGEHHIHAYTISSLKTPATCTTSAEYVYCCQCGAVGETYFDGDPLGHSYICNQTEPTCLKEGEALYTCNLCKDSYSEALSAKGHSFEESVAEQKATCIKEGNVAYKRCSECNNLFAASADNYSAETLATTTTVVDKDNHGKTELRNAKASTCREQGYTGDTYCLDCNALVVTGTETEKLNHTFVTDEAQPATCQQTGLTEGSHCSVCGTVLTMQEEIPKTKHVLSEYECGICHTSASWVLVTSKDNLTDGDKIIIACGNHVLSKNKSSLSATSVKITDNAISLTEATEKSVFEFTLCKSNSKWFLKNNGGQALGCGSQGFGWDVTTTAWTIRIEDGNATMKIGRKQLYFNKNNRTFCLKSSSSSSDALPQLYKLAFV